jgi:hypothetical protein
MALHLFEHRDFSVLNAVADGLRPGGIVAIDRIPFWDESGARTQMKQVLGDIFDIRGANSALLTKKAVLPARDGGEDSQNDVGVKKAGGIDFRQLPGSEGRAGVFPAGFADIPVLSSVQLEREWRQISKMVEMGVIPSEGRIREYAVNCVRRQAPRDELIACIAELLKLEEEKCVRTSPTLRDTLVLLDTSD